ncbi:hypothetical protein Tco_1152920 [Tanacetum coccineum]
MRALYSSHIACFQLGSRRAWNGDLEIGEEVVTCKLYLGLAFIVSTLECVTIGCCEVGGGGGGVIGGVSVVCGDGVDSVVGGVVCGFVYGIVCGVVKAPISTMIVSIPEKDRWCGTRGKFVWWKGVRVTKASKRVNVGGVVVKFSTMITLKSFDFTVELGFIKARKCRSFDCASDFL